jgi:uncharacterized protein YeaO (DUF488 family)
MVKLKRVGEPVARSDGYRVLVERLWPRGVRKQSLAMNEWAKDIAPSNDLRKWFAHDPERWTEFQQRYLRELDSDAASDHLRSLGERAANGTVTLLFSTHDSALSNAVVLQHEIEQRRGPRRTAKQRQSSDGKSRRRRPPL